jgi:hypothetical protein
MKLHDVISRIDELDEDDTIFLRPPWTEDSPAMVAFESDDGGLPAEAEEHGLGYFVEVAIAREILEDWEATRPTPPTVSERCARLIQYAVTDA